MKHPRRSRRKGSSQPESNAAQGTFGGIVVEAEAIVVEAAREPSQRDRM